MMQSFPIKKGINISRTHQPIPQFPNFVRQPPKIQQQINRTLPPQITVMNRIPNYNFQFNHNPNVNVHHHRTLSTQNNNSYQEKVSNIEPIPKVKALPVESYSNENMTFKFPFNNIQRSQQCIENKVSQTKKQLEISKSTQEYTKSDNFFTQTETFPQLKQPQSVYKEKQPLKQISQTSNTNIPPHLQNQEKFWSQKITNLQKQKQQLQLKQKIQIQKSSKWQQQKAQLLKSINEKQLILKENQEKSVQTEQQLKSKVTALEYELRLLKGNKNRLQIQVQSNRKLVRSQRQKNQKTKEQINKLIFFQDDLINAKDYNKLKDQLEYVHSQNTRLFQEHQKYILEVTQYRQVTNDKLKDILSELTSLKCQYKQYRSKIQSLIQGDQDKLALIKLQNEINFIRTKSQEQTEQLLNKENQLQKALLQIKQLTIKQNSKIQNHRNYMQETNIKQIQQTISSYEQRISDLQLNLNKKQVQNSKQKKTIELLTTQLRNTRQDRHINSMKGKSNENNLKNEVELLNKFYQTEIEVKDKKIYNLQESLQRKSKQIIQKDTFIKQFIIKRIKTIQNMPAEELIENIKKYFEPKEQPRND